MKRIIGIIYLFYFLCLPSVQAQEYWLPTNGPNGGVVSALVIDSNDRIYAGTLNGGVFLSQNQGTSWEQVNSGLPTWKIQTLCLTPDGDIFVATGKGDIFISRNHGKDWKISASSPSEIHTISVSGKGDLFIGSGKHGIFALTGDKGECRQTGLARASVQSIAIGPDDKLYAATTRGLFLSVDYGESWKPIHAPSSFILSLAIDQDGQLFAGTMVGKVYRSVDSGKSWTALPLDVKNAAIWSILVDRKGHILIGACGAGLYQSEDNGMNWTVQNGGLTDLAVRSIAVGNGDEVYVGTVSGVVFKRSELDLSVSENEFPIASFLMNLLQ